MNRCYLFLIFLLSVNCVTIRGTGSSTGHGSTQPVVRRVQLPCQKDPSPKPVCFSCTEAVKILNLKERCRQWPDRCKRRVQYEQEKLRVHYTGVVGQKDVQIRALEQKGRILQKEASKVNIAPYLIGGVIGLATGLTVGVVGCLIIYAVTR